MKVLVQMEVSIMQTIKHTGYFVKRELDGRFLNGGLAEVCYGGSFAVLALRLFVEPKLGPHEYCRTFCGTLVYPNDVEQNKKSVPTYCILDDTLGT